MDKKCQASWLKRSRTDDIHVPASQRTGLVCVAQSSRQRMRKRCHDVDEQPASTGSAVAPAAATCAWCDGPIGRQVWDMSDEVDDAALGQVVCSASCLYSCTRMHVGANCAVLATIKAEIEAECGHEVELVPGVFERYTAELAAASARAEGEHSQLASGVETAAMAEPVAMAVWMDE